MAICVATHLTFNSHSKSFNCFLSPSAESLSIFYVHLMLLAIPKKRVHLSYSAINAGIMFPFLRGAYLYLHNRSFTLVYSAKH